MAKITRYNGNLLPFAQNFTGGNRTVFGETTQSNSLTNNINTKFLQGWEATTDANTFPTKQDFNAVAYVSTALASYLHQVGIPEWNGDQEYHLNSFTNFSGVLYRCKTNNHTSVTNPASDATNWESVTGDFVSKTGNETIAGVKTFTSSPIVPTPTTDFQVANKEYVDNSVSVVPIVTGSATFTNSTNNIALTGIGALDGLEIGDVLQVSGSTNNDTEFTVEVITDANNVIVNQVHAGGTTTKALVDETATVTVKLLTKWYNASECLGQDIVSVKTNRATNVTYMNNTNRSIKFALTIQGSGGAQYYLQVGSIVNYVDISIAGSSARGSIEISIPAGQTYKVPTGPTIIEWNEVR